MNNYITLRKKILKVDGVFKNIRIVKLCDGSEFFQVQISEHRDFADKRVENFVTYKHALECFNSLKTWLS